MKRLLLLSLVVLLFLSACKKKKEDPVISIKGKWTAENMVIKEFYNSALTYSYTETLKRTTMDFQNNGNLIIAVTNSTETFPHTIKPRSKGRFDGSIYEFKNLTAIAVTLYYREEYAPGEYSEYFINLKK